MPYTDELKTDHTTKCKTYNYKASERKQKNLCDLGVGKGFFFNFMQRSFKHDTKSILCKKKKINKFINSKTFSSSKDTVKRMKR